MDWLQHLPTATWALCAACLALGWVAGYSFADARTARAGAAAVSSSNRAEEEDSIYDSSNSVSEVKMVLCVRQDLKMTKGKIAAQCGHAALGMYMKFQQREATLMQNWFAYGQAKIALKVEDESALLALRTSAHALNLPCHVVVDAGRTQIDPNTKTVLAILGPKAMVDNVTGQLKLL